MRKIIASVLFATVLATPAFGASAVPTDDEKRPTALSGNIQKGYADTAFGQIHYRIISRDLTGDHRPVVLFNPNPYSGLYYVHFMDVLGTDRPVIAFDTPGYGGSDKPDAPLSMAQIADIFAEALVNMGFGPDANGPVVVSGYHTGAYIAAEMAVSHADLVSDAVLVGVPFWQGAELDRQRIELLVDSPVPEDGSHLTSKWTFSVKDRHPLISVDRAQNLFAESLRAGRETWWAYSAVVNWPAPEQLSKISQPVLLLNNHGGLKEETRAVLPLLQNGTLVELPNLTHGIWDVGAQRLATEFRTFLDSEM